MHEAIIHLKERLKRSQNMYLCHVLTVYLGFIRCMKCAKVRAHNYLFSHAVVLTSRLNSKVVYYWT